MMPALSSSSSQSSSESPKTQADQGGAAGAAATSPPAPSQPERAARPKAWRPLRFALVTLAMLLTLAATVSLGRWQLSRAAQKIALQADIEAQKLQPPLDQDEFLALGDPASVLHRPVRLRGLWLAPQTVYLDNRQMHGLQGFYVLTPFAIEGSERTVLVQRGWIQRNFNDRTQLAPVATPGGLVEITAFVAPPPGRLLDLGNAAAPVPAASGASTPEAWAAAAASAASDAVATVLASVAPANADADHPTDAAAPGTSTVPAADNDSGAATVAGTAIGTGIDAVAVASARAASGAGAQGIADAGKAAPPLSSAARNAAAAAAITAARDRAVGSSPIRQNLDLSAFRAETRLPLRTDLTLQQAGAASEGLLRDWPAPALGVEKHHGYAFQWFGLAGLVVLLYVWFQLIAPWRRSRRQRHR